MRQGWLRRLGGVVVVALAMAGCTPEKVPTPTPPADAWRDHGPITFAVASGSTPMWEQAVAQWNSAHAGEPVTVVELSAADGAELARSGQAGTGEFTVMALDPAWTAEFASKGWLAELPSARFPTSGVLPAALDSGTWDGRLFAFPQSADATVLRYEGALLQRADQKPPTTWSALRASCSRLVTRQSETCYAGLFGDRASLTTSFASALWSAGGQFLNAAGEPDVDTPAGLAGLKQLTETVSSGALPKAAVDWSPLRARGELAAGRLVYLQDWWGNGSVGGQAQGIGVDVGVAAVQGSSATGVAVLGGRNLGIASAAANRGTAADFVNYLASAEVQRSLAEHGWSSPALADLYADADLLKQSPTLKTLAEVLKTARPLPATVHARELAQAVDDALRPALTGSRTPADALTDLQNRLEQLLK